MVAVRDALNAGTPMTTVWCVANAWITSALSQGLKVEMLDSTLRVLSGGWDWEGARTNPSCDLASQTTLAASGRVQPGRAGKVRSGGTHAQQHLRRTRLHSHQKAERGECLLGWKHPGRGLQTRKKEATVRQSIIISWWPATRRLCHGHTPVLLLAAVAAAFVVIVVAVPEM